MVEKISLLVPTRGRPGQILTMWHSALLNADDKNSLELVLYLDEDEPQMVDYLLFVRAVDHISYRVGPRYVLSNMWNDCSDRATGDILWHGNDDVLFRTNHWDTAVREAFNSQPDRILLVHGRDGYHDAKMSVLGFLHRRWMEAVGYFVPPYFVSDYNDLWLSEVADMIGRRRFLPEVYTEHMHPVFGKGPLDQTHQDRLTRHHQHNPGQLYETLAREREQWAAKLRAVME